MREESDKKKSFDKERNLKKKGVKFIPDTQRQIIKMVSYLYSQNENKKKEISVVGEEQKNQRKRKGTKKSKEEEDACGKGVCV